METLLTTMDAAAHEWWRLGTRDQERPFILPTYEDRFAETEQCMEQGQTQHIETTATWRMETDVTAAVW